jgi:nicotinamidase-related amidase
MSVCQVTKQVRHSGDGCGAPYDSGRSIAWSNTRQQESRRTTRHQFEINIISFLFVIDLHFKLSYQKKMAPALIVIDLQNDFLTPEGALGDQHIKFGNALVTLEQVCNTFSIQEFPVVFVRSEYLASESTVKFPEGPVRYLARPPGDKYQHVPMNDEYHSGTCHSAICKPESKGSEFPDAVKALADKYATKILIKHWYSAFTETNLHEWLQGQDVGNGPLFFAGVTANTCVLASLTDGFFFGYQVVAIRECVAAIWPKKLVKTFKTIETYYGHVASAADVQHITKDAATWSTHPRRILYYVNGSIPSWRVMMVLAHKKLTYTARRLKVMTPRERPASRSSKR